MDRKGKRAHHRQISRPDQQSVTWGGPKARFWFTGLHRVLGHGGKVAPFWTLSKHLQEPRSVPYYATNTRTHTHTAERENTVRREYVISLIPSVLKGFFFFFCSPTHYKIIIIGRGRLQGSCGVWGDQSITHRADQHLWGNIIMRHLSRLSEATSQWAPLFFFLFFFFCRYRQAKKKFLPHRQDSVWDFFFSIPPLHLAWVALLSLVCLTSVFDPELPLTDRILNNAVKGDTHTFI